MRFLRSLFFAVATVSALVWLGSCACGVVVCVRVSALAVGWFVLVSLGALGLAILCIVLAGRAGERAEEKWRDRDKYGGGLL